MITMVSAGKVKCVCEWGVEICICQLVQLIALINFWLRVSTKEVSAVDLQQMCRFLF